MLYQITFSVGDYRNTQGWTSIQQKSSKKKGYNERLHLRAVCFSARKDWNLSNRLLLISWEMFELTLEIADLLFHWQGRTEKTKWNQARVRAKGEGMICLRFFSCLPQKKAIAFYFFLVFVFYYNKLILFYLKVHLVLPDSPSPNSPGLKQGMDSQLWQSEFQDWVFCKCLGLHPPGGKHVIPWSDGKSGGDKDVSVPLASVNRSAFEAVCIISACITPTLAGKDMSKRVAIKILSRNMRIKNTFRGGWIIFIQTTETVPRCKW